MSVVVLFIRLILKILLLTCRFKVIGKDHLFSAIKQGPSLIALWHNRLLLMAPCLLKITQTEIFTAFISNSKDGNILAAYTKSYERGRVIRVSHNAKEHALRALIETLKKTHQIPIITPDGPRGPLYRLKPGIALAAKETEAMIVPFSWKCTSYWELSSWDRFRIPKPFSTIEAVFGAPFKLQKESTLDMDCVTIQKALQILV